jgi:tetratricopeptide (TPR) repeat protein
MLALRLRSRSEQSFARKSSRRTFSLSPFSANWVGVSLFLLCWGIFPPTFSFGQVTSRSTSYDEIASLIASRQLDSAVKLLNEFLAKSPNDVRAENLMGIALTEEGKLSEANRYFERATWHDPRFYPALKNLALNELRLNRPADAAAHLEKVLQFSPNDPVANFSLAEIYYSEKRFQEAAKHFNLSQELLFRQPRALLDYAASCAQANQGEKAARIIEKLPDSAAAPLHFRAGILLAQIARYADAAHQFKIAWKEKPDSYEVGYNLTLADLKSRDYSDAIQTAQSLISQGRKTSELYQLLSEAYEKSGKPVEAYDSLRAATLIDPKNENNYLDLVALSVDHVNYDLALRIANVGLQHVPGSYRLLLERGAVYAMKGQYEDAVRDIHAAAALQPGKDLPYFAESMALMELDRMKESIQILRQRVAINPNDYLLLYALGEALNRAGTTPGSPQAQEAIQALEKSVRLNPGFARSRAILGTLLLGQGKVQQAVAQLQAALRFDPDDLTPAYGLARAYRKLGNQELAAKYLAEFEKFKSTERNQYKNRRLITILRGASQ